MNRLILMSVRTGFSRSGLMKPAATLLIALLVACRHGAPLTHGAPASAGRADEAAQAGAPSVPASAMQDVAGESVETAVPVPAEAPNGGVDFENGWMYDRFGRFKRDSGGTGTLNGRRYDVVKIELPNGDMKTVYFDLTENWARWSPQSQQ